MYKLNNCVTITNTVSHLRPGGRLENLGVILIQALASNPAKYWEGALCVENLFYADISRESRCNIEINV